MDSDKAMREHLLNLLRGGHAHIKFEDAVANMPEELRGKKPGGLPYTPWQQVEHMRIAQWDILEYIRNPKHVSPEWSQGYWPDAMPPTKGAWAQSVRAFKMDLKAMQELVAKPSTKLLAQIPHGQRGHTILREVLVLADHTAYHLGQLIVLRRLLGAWED